MGAVLRSIDDLTDDDVRRVLERAAAHERGDPGRHPALPAGRGVVVGLLFLETSLRTRVGFTAAAARLGGSAVGVVLQRASEISMPESVHDTLRTLMGYTDVVVARPGVPLSGDVIPGGSTTPILSGGDRGPAMEHPSQALIDLHAAEQELGGLAGITVGICGDPRMRSVASLLRLMRRPAFRPRAVRLVTVPRLLEGFAVPPELAPVTTIGTFDDAGDVDFLYVAGIPHGAATEPERTALRVTPASLARLPASTVVTSPLPVIDEISHEAFADPRVRAFEHSDSGLFVRMALLEHTLAQR